MTGRLALVVDAVDAASVLARAGFYVGHADTRTAGERILAEAPDIVLAPVPLCGLVLDGARPRYPGAVLALNRGGGDDAVLQALEAGADDVVDAPVAPRVLLARVEALLRRVGGSGPAWIGALAVDRARREVQVDGHLVPLTSAEFNLVRILAEQHGRVVSRSRLFRDVLGVPYDGLDRGIDVHVSRVRRKLTRAGLADVRIVAVRGQGYQLTAPR